MPREVLRFPPTPQRQYLQRDAGREGSDLAVGRARKTHSAEISLVESMGVSRLDRHRVHEQRYRALLQQAHYEVASQQAATRSASIQCRRLLGHVGAHNHRLAIPQARRSEFLGDQCAHQSGRPLCVDQRSRPSIERIRGHRESLQRDRLKASWLASGLSAKGDRSPKTNDATKRQRC
jgi:hypothetical protein